MPFGLDACLKLPLQPFADGGAAFAVAAVAEQGQRVFLDRFHGFDDYHAHRHGADGGAAGLDRDRVRAQGRLEGFEARRTAREAGAGHRPALGQRPTRELFAFGELLGQVNGGVGCVVHPEQRHPAVGVGNFHQRGKRIFDALVF